MTAITISRQLGSMGCEVAQAVAKATGFRVVMREVINEAAQRAGSPELALHMIDELGLLGYHPSLEEQQAYQEALTRVIQEFAQEGNIVIVGRAGQVILHNWPEVLHVRVIAPAGLRAERLADGQNIPFDAAMAQVEASDRSRKNFLRRYYQVDWEDMQLYDLVINTQRLTPQAAAQMICNGLAGLLSNITQSPNPDVCID